MALLYPPIIEGTIPAFVTTEQGTIITVPYSMNKTVSLSQVSGLRLKIKTIESSYYIGEYNSQSPLSSNIATFSITDAASVLRQGEFYKIQLAYVDTNSTVGYYSTVGIIKYVKGNPTAIIDGLDAEESTEISETAEFVGVYNLTDKGEKAYSYEFAVYDDDELIFQKKDIHNTSLDTESNRQEDRIKLPFSLVEDHSYTIQYIVTTVNGLVVASPEYQFEKISDTAQTTIIEVLPNLNYYNGYINVKFACSSTSITGDFLILRSDSDNNYELWTQLSTVTLASADINSLEYKDFTIEQGKEYKYSIQQYTDGGTYYQKAISNVIKADYEDMFLYDGEHQLRLAFNPKVSSFKTTKLEQKVDTIGSQYPFIMRNGQTNYKEIPISALISYLMDDEQLFSTNEELHLIKEETVPIGRYKEEEEHIIARSTELDGDNFYAERLFKIKVLDWLNNGQVKLFKSPSEGNYLVQLINVSLQPTEQLGRMIHSFSATAYEIDECTYDNMIKYGIESGN